MPNPICPTLLSLLLGLRSWKGVKLVLVSLIHRSFYRIIGLIKSEFLLIAQ